MRIGIVAGEASGDLLAASLMRAIRARVPDVQFEGVAGPEMIAEGCRELFPAERLSVMGFAEVFGRLRELLGIRRQLLTYFCQNPPDVFIGVDAPDFNLTLERKLKGADIPVVHFVSPSVWAWRQYRVKKIARSINMMLTLFPFEADFYRNHQVPVRFVGHPLADMIPLQSDPEAARTALGISVQGKLVALLPGSRVSEVSRLADTFLRTAQLCADEVAGLQFIVPMVNEQTEAVFHHALQRICPDLSVTVIRGRSREVMAAADAILLASGTAALEGMLLKRPMVVSYRVSPITAFLARRLLKVPYVSLPNLLAGKPLIKELLQEDAVPDKLAPALLELLQNPTMSDQMQQAFTSIHLALRQDAGSRAAEAVLELLASNKS